MDKSRLMSTAVVGVAADKLATQSTMDATKTVAAVLVAEEEEEEEEEFSPSTAFAAVVTITESRTGTRGCEPMRAEKTVRVQAPAAEGLEEREEEDS